MIGIAGTATVIGSFIGSVPSIIAVILNYVKRGDARGTWVESHYRWQIRTFWFAVLWVVIAVLLILTVVGAIVGFPVLIALTLWLIYRIARGLAAVARQAPDVCMTAHRIGGMRDDGGTNGSAAPPPAAGRDAARGSRSRRRVSAPRHRG